MSDLTKNPFILGLADLSGRRKWLWSKVALTSSSQTNGQSHATARLSETNTKKGVAEVIDREVNMAGISWPHPMQTQMAVSIRRLRLDSWSLRLLCIQNSGCPLQCWLL